MPNVDVTHFTDPGCPWAYSARPGHAALRWRYGDQLVWRRVLIGLTEHAQQYVDRGYTPLRNALMRQVFKRYGMPLGTGMRERVAATSLACRCVVAARLHAPTAEEHVFYALQLAQFTTTIVLDEPGQLRAALAPIGHDGLVALAEDDPEVHAAYERDRAEARTAAGTATEFQGKHAQTDGPVRYTAPSLIFTSADGRALEAGGFQNLEAYDVLIANLDRALTRREPPEDVADVVDAFPEGISTQEVAEVMRAGNAPADRRAAEAALLHAVDSRRVTVTMHGDGAVWHRRA